MRRDAPGPYRIQHERMQHEPPPVGPPLETEEEFELRDLAMIWARRKLGMVALFLGSIALAALYALGTTPLYTAKTVLLIERQAPRVMSHERLLSQPQESMNDTFFETQFQMLRSRSLAAEIIRDHGLEEDEAFRGDLEPGLLDRVRARISALLPNTPTARPGTEGEIDPSALDHYLEEALEIEPLSGSRLVQVRLTSRDPGLSARIANAHAQAFIRRGLMLHEQIGEQATEYLGDRIDELRRRLEASEVALNAYRRDHEIVSLDDKENVIVERLNDLTDQLTQAESRRVELEAQVRLVRDRSYDSLPDVIANELVWELKQELASVEAETAYHETGGRTLSDVLSPQQSTLAKLRARSRELRAHLARETDSIVQGIESRYLAAVAAETEVRAKLEAQKEAAFALKDASIGYVVLEREAAANREIYESALQRTKEIAISSNARTSNVFVVDAAVPPEKPSRPRRALTLVLGGFMGFSLAMAWALAAELVDGRVRDPRQLQRLLQLPNLGAVPVIVRAGSRRLGATARSQGSSEVVVSQSPLSIEADAYRSIRTAIVHAGFARPPRTILFTSAIRGEGKTSTTLNTAAAFARTGRRVVVLDADFRRPRCHAALGLDNELGLSDVLAGMCDLDQVIQQTPAGPDVVTAGRSPVDPIELLGSERMAEVLAGLEKDYGHVLIDSPPLLPVSDAAALSTLVEGVVLVVDHRETPRRAIREAKARLAHAGATMLGVVLNRFDVRHSPYAYVEYGVEP